MVKLIQQYMKARKAKSFLKFINIDERKRRVSHETYGRVLRLEPSKVLKIAFIIDTIIPFTLFIPVVLAYIFKIMTKNLGIMIEIKK